MGRPTLLLAVGFAALLGACSSDERSKGGAQDHATLTMDGRIILTENAVDFVLEGLDVGGSAAISDSEFAVLDYRGKRVVIFDTLGSVVRTLGTEGGGPGELLFPQMLVPMLDGRLGVLDGRKSAIVVYAVGGATHSQLALDTLLGVSPTRITRVRQVAAQEWMISERVSAGNTRFEKLTLRSGKLSRTLDSTRAATTRPTVYPCNVVDEAGEPPVFWPTLRWDAVPGLVASASGARYAIAIASDTTRSRSFDVEPRKARREDALRERLGGSVRVGQTACKLTKEAALEQRSMSDVIPVVRAIRISPDRNIWVQRDTAPGEAPSIDILDSTGIKRTTHVGIAMPLFFLSNTTYVAMDSTASGELALTLWRTPGSTR